MTSEQPVEDLADEAPGRARTARRSTSERSGARPAKSLTLRDQQRLLTRERLLTAAMESFATSGYAQASVEDIARSVGASRATFYLHFKSKRDVLTRQIEDEIEGFVRRYEVLGSALENQSALTKKFLRDWLADWYVWWCEHATLMAAVREASVVEAEDVITIEQSARMMQGLETHLKSLGESAAASLTSNLLILQVMTQEVFNVMLASESLAFESSRAFDLLALVWWDVLKE